MGISFAIFIVLIVVISWFYSESDTTKLSKKTANEISEISIKLHEWKEKYGEYPSQLSEIIKSNPLRKSWNNDAWNQEYQYKLINDSSSFQIISAGPDKLFNTTDDITSD